MLYFILKNMKYLFMGMKVKLAIFCLLKSFV
ncbi:hypothetical protein GGR06_002536 [Bacteroides reticulotermitis]|uniref:Uncharacterized protein n=1 Tax=Bacteroides reticulotermitis TaxID=1133319 RepID=A0A840D2V1_9BACE|nr:hypothetical protein [Bacteroides reticulotermitis]